MHLGLAVSTYTALFCLNGEAFELDAEGLLTICIQHELDHLKGKLFIDYLSPLKRQRIRKKLEKEARLAAKA